MKHIEASRKIVTASAPNITAVKYSLVQRMRNAFNIETVGEGGESFSVTATSRMSTYAFSLNISLKADADRVRVLIDGQNELKMVTKLFYVISLLLVLLLGLLPSNTGGIVMNAIFFLLAGAFTIYDFGKKMDEPEIVIKAILNSLDVEFG